MTFSPSTPVAERRARIERVRVEAEQRLLYIVQSMLREIDIDMTVEEIQATGQSNEILRGVWQQANEVAYKQRCDELGVKPIRRSRPSKFFGHP